MYNKLECFWLYDMSKTCVSDSRLLAVYLYGRQGKWFILSKMACNKLVCLSLSHALDIRALL
jgi:hypothetical protein